MEGGGCGMPLVSNSGANEAIDGRAKGPDAKSIMLLLVWRGHDDDDDDDEDDVLQLLLISTGGDDDESLLHLSTSGGVAVTVGVAVATGRDSVAMVGE